MTDSSSGIPVLGVRRVGRTRPEPVLRLGRGEAPLVPGERAVARCRPYPSERMLSAASALVPWLMSPNVLTVEHESPAEGCACGIYALNRVEPHLQNAYVCVYLGWGRVFHGHRYWRASYVKPLALGRLGRPERFDPSGARSRWVKRICERYDIPVLGGEDLH